MQGGGLAKDVARQDNSLTAEARDEDFRP